WTELPRGVKFDRFDHEIIWHLLAKSGVIGFQPHPFIDEFIPTVAKEYGISYTHPQKSPTSTVTKHVNISVVDSSSAEPTTIVSSSIEVPNLPKIATSTPNNLQTGSTRKWGFAFGLNLGQRTLGANDSAGSVSPGSTSASLQSVGKGLVRLYKLRHVIWFRKTNEDARPYLKYVVSFYADAIEPLQLLDNRS
ncbi:hypothetical protein Tco_1551142, partial [Tanacetum coccineum]